MWIKERPEVLGESGADKVNFLYNSDKIYIMDNHLSAAWCWLQKIDTSRKYNYVHIDRHYDLLDFETEIKNEVINKSIDLQKLTFEEYINLSYNVPRHPDMKAKVFRWDNYIHNIVHVYPTLFASTSFITKKVGAVTEFVQYEYEIEEFLSEYEHWLQNSNDGWIVNLDLDYFIAHSRGYFQLYSDETINRVAKLLKKNIDKIDVLTIALSPECCDGWKTSFKILEIFTNTLEIDL